MTPSPNLLLGLLVAALGGLVVGLDRERAGSEERPSVHFAGIRTFTLLGMAGGLAGWMWRMEHGPLGMIIAAGVAALTVAAYAAASRKEVDGTTEVAALVVLAASMIAGLGYLPLASGVFAVTGLLLVEKARLHDWASRLDDTGLRAGVRFGVMAVVILPLLPAGPIAIGPLEIRPQQIWLLVLFFSGISFAGYIARRLVGLRRGFILAGLLGGLVSSTNVTLTFARLSRAEPGSAVSLALGTVAANLVLFPRVMLSTMVLNGSVARELWPLLVGAFGVALVAGLLGIHWAKGSETEPPPLTNPLQVRSALMMAAGFQVVIWIVDALSRAGDKSGLLVTAAILGATDVDALTVSMSRAAAAPAATAAQAIAVGILANTVVKLLLAVALGTGRYRLIAGGVLSLMALVGAGSLWMLR